MKHKRIWLENVSQWKNWRSGGRNSGVVWNRWSGSLGCPVRTVKKAAVKHGRGQEHRIFQIRMRVQVGCRAVFGGSVREKGNKTMILVKWYKYFSGCRFLRLFILGDSIILKPKNAIHKKGKNCRKQLFELHKRRWLNGEDLMCPLGQCVEM